MTMLTNIQTSATRPFALRAAVRLAHLRRFINRFFAAVIARHERHAAAGLALSRMGGGALAATASSCAALLQPFDESRRRDWSEVVASTLLMLQIADIVEHGTRSAAFSFADSTARLARALEAP